MNLHKPFLLFTLWVGLPPQAAGADVTVLLKQTVTQKEPVETSQTNTLEVSIRRAKRRTELLSLRYGDGPEERIGIFRIDDLRARKSTSVYPFLKGYEEETLERLLLDKRSLDGLPPSMQVTNTERTKVILEQPCREVAFEAELRTENKRLTGSLWVSNGPGASDYRAFENIAVRLVRRAGDAVYDIGGDYFAVSYAVAVVGGIPYELTYEEFDQTTGRVVSRTDIAVLRVSTARVRDSAFEVPRGYRRCPGNACGR